MAVGGRVPGGVERAVCELKPLSTEGIPRALDRAVRYRLLGEPGEAESICLDILAADPDNHSALVTLILAITDQFHEGPAAQARRARELLPRLPEGYEALYYEGVICERQGKADLRRCTPGCERTCYDWLQKAMDLFERAEALHPPGNHDAILRWNACSRTIARYKLDPTEPDYPPSDVE